MQRIENAGLNRYDVAKKDEESVLTNVRESAKLVNVDISTRNNRVLIRRKEAPHGIHPGTE